MLDPPIVVASNHWFAVISVVSVVKLVRDKAMIYSVIQIWMDLVEISSVSLIVLLFGAPN